MERIRDVFVMIEVISNSSKFQIFRNNNVAIRSGNDIQLSKQGYRDGDDFNRVLSVYRLAASLIDLLV